MEDAARARNAARDALADVRPEQLREALESRIADAAVTPGVLALVTARAVDPDVEPSAVVERAAGVQLIYEGLRLTRTVAHEEPWATAAAAGGSIDADMDVLAADVLVSRGILASGLYRCRAIRCRRGARLRRDQTVRDREGTDADAAAALDRNLEVDALELAVVAGTTAVGDDPPEELLAYARELAADCDDGFLPASRALSDATADRIADISDRAVSAPDR